MAEELRERVLREIPHLEQGIELDASAGPDVCRVYLDSPLGKVIAKKGRIPQLYRDEKGRYILMRRCHVDELQSTIRQKLVTVGDWE